MAHNELLRYYTFFGKILGKALLEGINIEPVFSQFFLKKLASKCSSLEDLRYLDKELYKHLNFLKTYEGDIEDLCLTYQINEDDPVTGYKATVDLVPNAAEISVTNANIFKYVYMVMDYKTNLRIKDKVLAFTSGFHSIIPANWL
jgi:ubiquitin-protein ligase E3 C